MAVINQVDYEAIPGVARQMRTLGQELNNELTTAYAKVSEMHNYWYGNRYNELVKGFNGMIPGLNELLGLVVREIPYALETIANNYGKADKGVNITSASMIEPKKIAELAVPSDVGMKFLSNEVGNIKNGITTNFNKTKEKMNALETTFNKITWQSESATTFKAKFKSLKNDIINALDEVETSFNKLMTQAINDMQAIEKANNING